MNKKCDILLNILGTCLIFVLVNLPFTFENLKLSYKEILFQCLFQGFICKFYFANITHYLN